MSIDDLSRLFQECADSELFYPTLVALGSGLRRGELLALRWRDFRYDLAALFVTRALERVNGELRFKDTKTRRSRRTVIVPRFAIETLVCQRARQQERFRLLGLPDPDCETVIFDHLGHPWDPGLFSLAFYRLKHRLGMDEVSFHDLRHAFASFSLLGGADLKVVSEALGHSSVSTTADRYTHIVRELFQDMARRLDGQIRPALPESWPTLDPPHGNRPSDGS